MFPFRGMLPTRRVASLALAYSIVLLAFILPITQANATNEPAASTNVTCNEAFMYAIGNQTLDVVKTLFETSQVNASTVNCHFPVGNDLHTPLTLATVLDDLVLVTFLLNQEGIDVNFKTGLLKQTALMLSMSAKTDDMAMYLISQGAQVNDASGAKTTVFMFAAVYGKLAVLKKIMEIDSSVDINAVNQFGRAAVHYVMKDPEINMETFKYLLSLKAFDVNVAADKANYCRECSLLGIAIQDGETPFVDVLLNDERIDVNFAARTSGNTPLMIAALYNRVALATKLAAASGIKLNVVNKTGQTALQMAMSPAMKQVLSNAGAAIEQKKPAKERDESEDNRTDAGDDDTAAADAKAKSSSSSAATLKNAWGVLGTCCCLVVFNGLRFVTW